MPGLVVLSETTKILRLVESNCFFPIFFHLWCLFSLSLYSFFGFEIGNIKCEVRVLTCCDANSWYELWDSTLKITNSTFPGMGQNLEPNVHEMYIYIYEYMILLLLSFDRWEKTWRVPWKMLKNLQDQEISVIMCPCESLAIYLNVIR